MTHTTAPTAVRRGPPTATRGSARPGARCTCSLVFVLAMTAVSVLAGLFWTGVGLLILIVGLPIVVLSLLVARGFGVADRYLLSLTGLPEIAEPEWSADRPTTDGFLGDTDPSAAQRPLLDIPRCTAMIISPILSTVTFALTTVWLSVSLGGLTYWFWGSFIPRGDGGEWGQYVAAALPWLFGGWSSWAVEVVLYLVAGILFAITLPWAMGGFARRPPRDRARAARALAQRRPGRRGASRGGRPRRRRAGRERRAASAGARHPRRPAAAPRAAADGSGRPRTASRRR